MPVRKNQFIDTHILGQFVECFSLDKFGTGVGQESFSFARKMMVDDVAYYCVENGITEKFKSFIVYRFTLVVAVHDALVHQRHFIIFNIVGIKTYNFIKRKIKLFILAEREFYSIYKIIQYIS